MKYRYPLLWVICLAFTLVASACSQAAQPTVAPTQPAAGATATTVPAGAPAAATPTTAPASPAASSSSGSGAPLTQVTVGIIGGGTTGGVAMYLASDKGYMKQQGLDLKFVPFQTGADMIPALAQGQLDAGMGALSAAVFNAIGRGINIRLVAEPTTNDNSEGLVVRADLANQIKTWSDLKGRKVALSGTGSSVEINLDAALKQGGLTMKDVNVVTMGFPDMLTAMQNKAIDVAYEVEPLISMGVDKKLIVRWKNAGEMNPNHQVGVIMYSSKFATSNPKAAKGLMLATLKGGRDFLSFLQTGKDKQGVVASSIKNTMVKDAKMYDTMPWPGITPDMAMKAKSLQTDLAWYVSHGYVKDPPDLTKAIDNSYVQYALDKLGPYKP